MPCHNQVPHSENDRWNRGLYRSKPLPCWLLGAQQFYPLVDVHSFDKKMTAAADAQVLMKNENWEKIDVIDGMMPAVMWV